MSDAIDAGPVLVHREQERLAVDDAARKPKPAAATQPAAAKKRPAG